MSFVCVGVLLGWVSLLYSFLKERLLWICLIIDHQCDRVTYRNSFSVIWNIQIPTAHYEFGANFLDPNVCYFLLFVSRLYKQITSFKNARITCFLSVDTFREGVDRWKSKCKNECDLSENLSLKGNVQVNISKLSICFEWFPFPIVQELLLYFLVHSIKFIFLVLFSSSVAYKWVTYFTIHGQFWL